MGLTKMDKPGTGLVRWLLAGIVSVALTACATSNTDVKSIESVPEVSKSYSDLMVFAVTKNSGVRSTIEQQVAGELASSGFQAAQFPETNDSLPWGDPQTLGNTVFDAGKNSDGVLVMSLERKERETNYVPEQVIYQPEVTSLGPLASTTYMKAIVIPAHADESVAYVIRSTLYDSDTRAPVWRLYSSTVNPKSLEAGAKDFAKVLVKALNKTLPKASQ
eukprot:TRINITY_DN8858_c0_g1_i1.p1 TRINITY_DN8858_c0_g1~~TRINITY_DN8858_c0_g1_i1.p1  ORF type:complete len:219 (+),score=31.40 TRINITY_DN8858_c0_g1_i1:126-782(+)